MDHASSQPITFGQLAHILASVRPPASTPGSIPRHGPADGDPTANPPADAVIDAGTFDELAAMVGDDAAFLRDLVATFAHDGDALLSDLGQAVRENDQEVVLRIAHTFKSSTAMFGALGASHIARKLEDEAKAGHDEAFPALVQALKTAFAAATQALEVRVAR